MSKYLYLTDDGGFNSLPSPYQKCNQSDFLDMLLRWEPLETEFRQVHYDPKDRMRGVYDVKIFYFHNEAFAYGYDWKMVRYFFYRIGCSHPHVEHTSLGKCKHQYKCAVCGTTWITDSSD